LWLRGGFPDSYLAASELDSFNWRLDFISTFVERDLPNMGAGISALHFKRFWRMLAHYHANQVNYSELGRSLELSHTTVKHYLDTLTGFYMVRQLEPYAANVKKRLVKSPKIYLRDSGILHSLLNLPSMNALLGHPALGGSWEGFVVENIVSQLDSRWNYYYYRTATQVEIDLILITPTREVWAVEIKRNSAPKLGRGFFEACEDVKADRKFVVYALEDSYPLKNNVQVIGLRAFLKLLSEQV
jgi:predicted AAA+ superfamily ATPase